MDHTNADQAPNPLGKGQQAAMNRRRLLRAGLSAAPVMAGLKSQSALATNGICTPSIWTSLKAANYCVSGSSPPQQTPCKPHTWWCNSSHSACNTYYHGTNYGCAGYAGTHFTTSRNFKQVCQTSSNSGYQDDKSKLGRHCAAMHLNATVYPSTCPVDAATCKQIWSACKDGGSWTPVSGGTPWTRKDCIDYFDYICGIKSLNCV